MTMWGFRDFCRAVFKSPTGWWLVAKLSSKFSKLVIILVIIIHGNPVLTRQYLIKWCVMFWPLLNCQHGKIGDVFQWFAKDPWLVILWKMMFLPSSNSTYSKSPHLQIFAPHFPIPLIIGILRSWSESISRDLPAVLVSGFNAVESVIANGGRSGDLHSCAQEWVPYLILRWSTCI